MVRLNCIRKFTAAIAERHLKKKERLTKVNNLVRKFELQNVMGIEIKVSFGGQVRKLTLAMAMVKDTKILILDEPFAALDPQSKRTIQQIIVSLQMFERIYIIFLITPLEISLVVDNAMILSEGKIIGKGTPQDLVKNTKAIEAYFGVILSFNFF